MDNFIGIYGFAITRPIQVAGVTIEPCFAGRDEVNARANEERQFVLTAVGKLAGPPNDNPSFELAAAMTFCEQRWVIINGPFGMHRGTTVAEAKNSLPSRLDFQVRRQRGGTLIMEDTFTPRSRQQFLDVCVRRLQDQSFNQSTGFREAFFRHVEVWRLNPAYIDVTYYLNFSALELLARRRVPGRLSFPEVAARFLRRLGFHVKQKDPSRRVQSMETYGNLRNKLFHEGKLEASIDEGGRDMIVKLADYEEYLRRLVPDVLLKVLGFDDGHINWNRWLDRMSFTG